MDDDLLNPPPTDEELTIRAVVCEAFGIPDELIRFVVDNGIACGRRVWYASLIVPGQRLGDGCWIVIVSSMYFIRPLLPAPGQLLFEPEDAVRWVLAEPVAGEMIRAYDAELTEAKRTAPLVKSA